MAFTDSIRKKHRSMTVALAFALSVGAPFDQVESFDELSVAVQPHTIAPGGTVRMTVRVPRDSTNARLRLEIEASQFYTSSDIALNGAGAAVVHERTWEALPPGDYQATASVWKNDDSVVVATAAFTVRPMTRR